MNFRVLFYTISAFGFFFPYLLKFLITSPSDEIKIFALYSLGKFNLIYFAVVIIFFFLGLMEKYKFFRIAQVLFVPLFLAYILVDYFVLTKNDVKNYITTNHLNAKLVSITELKNYPNFQILYKKGKWAAVKILPKQKNSLPFNYKKQQGF